MTLDEGIKLLNNPKGVSIETGDKFTGSVNQVYGSWSGHVQSWMPFDRKYMYVMRYEDMLDKPEETFGGMVRFLGLNPPKERFLKAIEFSSFKTVRQQEEEKGFFEQSPKNERFFRIGKSGQWKDVLSKKQVDKIVKCHYQTMKQFGYLPD